MIFDEIIRDNTSGSAAIVENTIRELISFISKEKNIDPVFLRADLLRLFEHHANFAVLYHFTSQFLSELDKNHDKSYLLEFLSDYQSKWKSVLALACENLLNHLSFEGKKILVHSNSSAIHLLFSKIAKSGLHTEIYQTLSSPAAEGKIQAAVLSKLGFEINLIHENAVGNIMEKLDMAVFGADLITEDYFVNKAGTFQLALLFKHFKKPVFVLADSRKVIRDLLLSGDIKLQILEEKMKPPEVLWENQPLNIQPLNYWFEKTPLSLVSGLATEIGVTDGGFCFPGSKK
jgi:translation initiation factor 2B subunit (eIF-2B alpha/beta/delta family)